MTLIKLRYKHNNLLCTKRKHYDLMLFILVCGLILSEISTECNFYQINLEKSLEKTTGNSMAIYNGEIKQYESGWVVTGYCKCSICCNEFAYNRPIDEESGEEIVYGSSGKELIAGYSCAADLPSGTKVEILFSDGSTQIRRVDDTGGAVCGKHIDLYESSHEKALEIGCQIVGVRIVE